MFFYLIRSDSLEYNFLHDEIESMRHLIDTSNNVISNELSTVNIVMAVASIVLAIVGILLGAYISSLSKKVESMKDIVSTKSKEVESLAKIVDETDKKIQSDISGLYAKLRKEETIALLRRLELEPLDISNLEQQLLSRDLGDDEYVILRNAYRNLVASGDADVTHGIFNEISYRNSYLLLFFQHYPKQSIMDDEIRQSMISFFKYGLGCAFKRDVINSTRGICLAISDQYAEFNKEEILYSYLSALNDSKYKDYTPLRDVFEESITKTDLLVDVIEACKQKGVYLQLFGIVPPTSTDAQEISSEGIS